MKNLALALIIIIIASCSIKEPRPKVTYNTKGEKTLVKDTMAISIADLPIHIDSTEFLVHPIGELNFYDTEKNGLLKTSLRYDSNINFKISNYSDYNFTGQLTNLLFEKIGTDKLVPLTHKNLKITNANFLSELYKNTGKKLFLYQIIDADTNNDDKLNHDDIQTMYVSKIDGSNFKKLVVDNHEILDWKILPSVNRLYYKYIENTNGNDVFDKDDTIHYQYINLLDDTLKIVEYYPVTN